MGYIENQKKKKKDESELSDKICDRLSEIEGSVRRDPKLRKEIVQLMANLPAFIEFMPTWAAMQRARYNALLEEGFTEAQAIEMCKGY